MKLPDVPSDIAAAAALEDAQQRRERQRAENQAIGEAEADTLPTAGIITLDEMLRDYAFIVDGGMVARIGANAPPMPWRIFQLSTAPSYDLEPTLRGGMKEVAISSKWIKHRDHVQLPTITFRAGADQRTRSPDGRQALNMWSPRASAVPPDDWEAQAAPFVKHIGWLFGPQANAFLDWLAHIEQQPGVLPHSGWLHVAPHTGMGRNWLTSVLVRVWDGDVAVNLTLEEVLGSFNGHRLSRKLLAGVDEVHADQLHGGKWVTMQKIKTLITAEVRTVEFKFGAKIIEWNLMRWLIFSNHFDSVPMDKEDRRFNVASCLDLPKPESYYIDLYGLLKKPGFILSVRHWLAKRDISKFNPGARPLMSEAKASVMRRGQHTNDVVLEALKAHWPCDLIDANTLTRLAQSEAGEGAVFVQPNKHQLERAGVVPYMHADGGRVRKVKIGGKAGAAAQKVHILRNQGRWHRAEPSEVAAELNRCELFGDKALEIYESMGEKTEPKDDKAD